jgi:hypothetical protein
VGSFTVGVVPIVVVCYSGLMTNYVSVTIHVNGTTVSGDVLESTARTVDAILSNDPAYAAEMYASTHIDFDFFHFPGKSVTLSQSNVRLLKSAITGIVYHYPTLRT